MMKPLYVKDTNDFVLYYRWDTWCIARDLSMLNVEICINPRCGRLCPNYQDYNENGRLKMRFDNYCSQGNWKTPNGKIHDDKSFRIDCVGEVKTPFLRVSI